MHYPVIAELVDETSGKRFMPGDTFMPASEKQRVRLTNAGCLGEDAVDPAADLADLPLGSLSREHLENIALGIARAQIGEVSDDELRDGIEQYRAKKAAYPGQAGDDAEGAVSDDLEDRTVDQLKTIAGDEAVDLSGKTLKADIVSAIRAARTAKAGEA